MATTLQNQFETIIEDAKTNIHGVMDKANNHFDAVITDTRKVGRKAALASLGVWSIAYDNVRSFTENFETIVEDAGDKAISLFTEAVERGTAMENQASARAEKIRAEANERFGDIESRIKETLGRAETIVAEEVEVVETVAADVEEEAVDVVETVVADAEAVVETVTLPFDDYADLTAKVIVERLSDMSHEQLAAVQQYEAANANRVTIIREVERLLAG